MKRKSIITLIVMLIMLFAFGALNASAEIYGDLTYEVSNGEITITDCSTSAVEITIPSYINEVPVTKIGDFAFYGCKNLLKISFEENNKIATIGEYAFYNCLKLNEFIIPNTLTFIGDYAFKNCDTLKNIKIPDSVTEIGKEAFNNCDNLTNIEIGTGVLTIGETAFGFCKKLNAIEVSNGNTVYSSCDGNLFNKSKTELIQYTIGKTDKTYSLPIETKSIEKYSFWYALNLNSVIMENSVIEIKEKAFFHCSNIQSINLSSSIEVIESCAFYGCSKLKEIELPDTISQIGTSAFEYCESLEAIQFPASCSSIADSTFKKCTALHTFSFEDKLNYIGTDAFNNCTNLKNINYPDEVEWNNIEISSGNSLFENCIPCGKNLSWSLGADGILTITGTGSMTDYGNSLTQPWIYDRNAIKQIIIEDGVTSIGSAAFLNCINLEKVSMPNSITQIGFNAFFGCQKLSDINFSTNISSIGDRAFYECEALKVVVLYDNLINIGEFNFSHAEKLETITIPSTVQTLGYGTFFGSNNIKQINYNGTENEWNKLSRNASIPSGTFIRTKEYDRQYTYKFVDNAGKIFKQLAVDYKTEILAPNNPICSEPLEFVGWEGFSKGMLIKNDVTFVAKYKFKSYTIEINGQDTTFSVTYNENYKIEPLSKGGYTFIGYFTEENGNGNQITNENGESLSPYNVVGNMNVYPYFYSQYVNKIELQGTTYATLGDAITQKAIFATDKSAMYLTATIKYPKHLEFRDIKGVDFIEASEEPEKTVDDFKYLDITCLYNYQGENIPVNTNLVPFEIEFVVTADAKIGNTEIAIENVLLSGATNYNIVDITNHTLEIKAKLAESIEIIGEDYVDKPTQFNASISPDYATNKSIIWSVDDEAVATVSQNGVVTPIKNGSVILTATTLDGSGLSATKAIEISAYAKIDSLDFGNGTVLKEFNADAREYIVYVREDATSITLTPTFSGGGVLRANGSGIWASNSPKVFEITEEEPTIITLNRENVTDMTNGVYTIKVVKFEGTKSEISNNDKTFKILPINIETGKFVILALYDNKQLVDMQKTTNNGEEITFTTSKTYTNAKVMVWDDFTTLRPVCNTEIVR